MMVLAAIAEGMVAGGAAIALGAPLWVGWVVGYAVYIALEVGNGLVRRR